MSEREQDLDIDEIERRVAQALVDLVDGPGEQPKITIKLLAARSKLSLRRVREVTNEWQLRTISGDELFLAPGTVDHARERARVLRRED